jgi:hypothetical protein
VFRKSYSSKSRFFSYQHEQAFLLAKGRPPLPKQPLADVMDSLRRIALAPYTRREMCQRRQTTAALKQVETWRTMNAWSPLPCRHGRRKIFH